MNGWNASKFAGLSLLGGVCLMIASRLLTPGSLFIAPASPGNVVATVRSMGAYPALAHFSSNLAMVGVILAIFGFWYILRCQQTRDMSAILIQVGAVLIILALVGLAVGRGMVHAVAHALTAPDATGVPHDQLHALAGALEAVRGGLRVMAALVVFAGSLSMALGLRSRTEQGWHRALATLAGTLSALAIICFVLAQQTGQPAMFYKALGIIGVFMLVLYFSLGVALYREWPGFHRLGLGTTDGQESSDH